MSVFKTRTKLLKEIRSEIFNWKERGVFVTFHNISLLCMLKWLEIRTDYLVNSWVYTTNHKRIGVNYISFVYVAGTAGLSLATVMRIEFAYPGVSFLVGDSIQYLSIAAAHGVIMVFFMIMPSLFGAFGNFLLPTQLGVHDVAFPRLNSAAFWFLPGGLIMLCHTICVDRRYQNLNLFNVREIQTMLNAKYLEQTTFRQDFRDSILKSGLGLRYIENFETSFESGFHILKSYGVTSTNKSKVFSIQPNNKRSLSESLVDSVFASLTPTFEPLHPSIGSDYVASYVISYFLMLVRNVAGSLSSSVTNLLLSVNTHFVNNIQILLSSTTSTFVNTNTTWLGSTPTQLLTNTSLISGTVLTQAQTHESKLDTLSFANFNKIHESRPFSNDFSWIGYDIKLGHFIPRFMHKYPLMFPSFIEVDYKKQLDKPNSRLFDSNEFLSTLWTMSDLFTKNFYIKPTIETSTIYIGALAKFPKSSNLTHLWAGPLTIAEPATCRVSHLSLPIINSTKRLVSYGELIPDVILLDWGRKLTLNWMPFLGTHTWARFKGLSSFYKNQSPLDLIRDSAINFPKTSLIDGPLVNKPLVFSYIIFHDPTSMFSPKGNAVRYPAASQRFNKAMESNSKYHDFANVEKSPLDGLANSVISSQELLSDINSRFIAFSLLSQKYNTMFNTVTMQQRLLNRWRTLKFTREAWRCKFLLSRNQDTLFTRRVPHEGFVLECYRNARDLIPGWAMITPFSSRTRYTAIGKVDVGLMAVFLAVNASIISSVNFLVTYRYLSTLNNRKMRDARSFFTESIMVASWMMIAANPMLAIGILMLLADRHWRTSFFDFSGGGDAVLFQHMFWFFGHPEVYVIMIPVFGFTNTTLSFYLRKRISARASLIYSMYTIAFLGFWVWGHHMYMVGLSHSTRMLFSTLTVMISVPAATKIMHWCVTIVNSAFIVEIPLLYTFLFMFFFISGGISGMAVAHTGMDILFHDTFYVIGHFHVMLAGAAMFGIFGAIYFYFPALYGVRYSRVFAYIHFVYYLFGQILTVVPMFWLGYCGMPRRVFDYPYVLGGWHSLATSGHFLSLGAMIAFFIMIYDSVRRAKPSIRKTFGPVRFNVRVNFFMYELARLKYITGGTRGTAWLPADVRSTLTIDKPRQLKRAHLVASENTCVSYTLVNKGHPLFKGGKL